MVWLDPGGECLRLLDVLLLCRLVTSTQNDKYSQTLIDEIHPVAGPEMFPHFENAISYRLNVTKISHFGFQ